MVDALNRSVPHPNLYSWKHTGSRPISFITVIPAFLHSSSSSSIAGETYEVVTMLVLVRMPDLITTAWKVYGIREMARSTCSRALSSAASSLTSSEMALVFLNPAQSF